MANFVQNVKSGTSESFNIKQKSINTSSTIKVKILIKMHVVQP